MGSFISRQPNGLLCRFSTVVDTVTHYNMTDEGFIEFYIERAKKDAEAEAKTILEHRLYPFDDVINSFIPNNMSQEEFNKFVELMKKTK